MDDKVASAYPFSLLHDYWMIAVVGSIGVLKAVLYLVDWYCLGSFASCVRACGSRRCPVCCPSSCAGQVLRGPVILLEALVDINARILVHEGGLVVLLCMGTCVLLNANTQYVVHSDTDAVAKDEYLQLFSRRGRHVCCGFPVIIGKWWLVVCYVCPLASTVTGLYLLVCVSKVPSPDHA